MNRQILKQMLVTAGAAAGLAWGVAQAADPSEYLLNPQQAIVVNDYQQCWETMGGLSGPRAECGDIVDSDGDGVPDDRDQCPDTPAGVAVDEDGCPTDDDNDGVPNHRDKCPDTRPGARVDKDGCEIVDSVVLDVVADGFDFDKSNLKPHMMNDLRTLADRIKASPGNEAIKIIGHTDSIGTEAYNQGLSERRAKSVANYLGKEGVDRGKMAISGKGESEPVADNRTDEGRARNRRVEVHTR